MQPSSPSKKKRPGITRAANTPGSGVGKKRHLLYAGAYRQIERARARGFYIEAIAICESIIADRLEARRACLNPDDSSKRRFDTLGHLTSILQSEETAGDDIKRLYKELAAWGKRRNEAVHMMLKLGSEYSAKAWDARYKDLRKTMERGIELSRSISRQVEALN